MEDINDKKILKRIRALLAKARDASVTEAEAAMFAQKAAQMLQEHNLTEAALGGDDATEPLVQRIFNSVDWNPWRIEIVDQLAGLYFSRIYITSAIHQGKLRRAVMLVGRPHNLDVVESMHEYLVKTTIRLAKAYSTDRKTVLQFEKGCGMRLATRVGEMRRAAAEPTPRVTHQPGMSGLPALYKTELQLAQDIVLQVCGNSKARATGHRGGGDAARAGRNAANSVNLGGQIGRSGGGSRMLGNG